MPDLSKLNLPLNLTNPQLLHKTPDVLTKFLSKTPRAFTLVELLVVIAILAILATIGVAILSGTQSKARDAKRKGDISAMSKAMEANYTTGTGYQTVVQASWFADGVKPSNPGPGGSTYFENTITSAAYIFCANLENNTGNSMSSGTLTGTSTGTFFCKKNAQ